MQDKHQHTKLLYARRHTRLGVGCDNAHGTCDFKLRLPEAFGEDELDRKQ